jgi:hypothetical protein
MSNTTLYQKKFHFKSIDDVQSQLIKIISDLWYDKSIKWFYLKSIAG